MRRQRAAGRLDHLERAQAALAVARLQPGRHAQGRTPRGGHASAAAGTVAAQARSPARSAAGISGIAGHAVQQGVQVEAGAADDDRRPPVGPGLSQHRLDQRQPAADRGLLVRGEHAVEPVRRRRPRRRRVGRAVRIGRSANSCWLSALTTTPPSSPGQAQRQGRLAAGGAAAYDDQRLDRPPPRRRWSAHAGRRLPDRRPRTVARSTRGSWPPRPRALGGQGALARRGRGRGDRHRDAGARRTPSGCCAPLRRPAPPVDLAVLPAAQRRKRLLLCDMDSTIITIECIDELADMAGIKPQIAAVTRRAMNGELDFAAALRERVALLAGLPRAAIDRVIARAPAADAGCARRWCGRCARTAPAPPWSPAASPRSRATSRRCAASTTRRPTSWRSRTAG